MVSAGLKAVLKERSARRIKESTDFAKLAKEIELLKAWKDRKRVPLDEKELREQFSKEAEAKIEQKANELSSAETPPEGAAYKFKRNFLGKEVLHIMEDFLQGDKLAPSR